MAFEIPIRSPRALLLREFFGRLQHVAALLPQCECRYKSRIGCFYVQSTRHGDCGRS